MPIINGKVVRSRYTSLKLDELSAVDRPAQPGALATIMKRADERDSVDLILLAKYVMDTDGAHSFAEVVAENEFSQKIWPFTDALSQSIRSIVGDKRLIGDEREAKINESVASFLQRVREISPEVAKQLEGLVNKKDGPMPKSIQELETELATTTSKLAVATEQVTTLTARAEKAEGELATAQTELTAAKAEGGDLATIKAELATAKADLAKATDETISVGGAEVRKSEIGENQFKVMKALADERDLAKLEKRATGDYGHVVGTSAEKAKVLKVIDGIADENTRKAATAILTSAEKMTKGAFDMIGGGGGVPPSEEQAAAKANYDAEVQKHVDGGMKQTDAMAKVRRDKPDLFKSMQGEQPASAQ